MSLCTDRLAAAARYAATFQGSYRVHLLLTDRGVVIHGDDGNTMTQTEVRYIDIDDAVACPLINAILRIHAEHAFRCAQAVVQASLDAGRAA